MRPVWHSLTERSELILLFGSGMGRLEVTKKTHCGLHV